MQGKATDTLLITFDYAKKEWVVLLGKEKLTCTKSTRLMNYLLQRLSWALPAHFDAHGRDQCSRHIVIELFRLEIVYHFEQMTFIDSIETRSRRALRSAWDTWSCRCLALYEFGDTKLYEFYERKRLGYYVVAAAFLMKLWYRWRKGHNEDRIPVDACLATKRTQQRAVHRDGVYLDCSETGRLISICFFQLRP